VRNAECEDLFAEVGGGVNDEVGFGTVDVEATAAPAVVGVG